MALSLSSPSSLLKLPGAIVPTRSTCLKWPNKSGAKYVGTKNPKDDEAKRPL